jgi:hypothetical protein
LEYGDIRAQLRPLLNHWGARLRRQSQRRIDDPITLDRMRLAVYFQLL